MKEFGASTVAWHHCATLKAGPEGTKGQKSQPSAWFGLCALLSPSCYSKTSRYRRSRSASLKAPFPPPCHPAPLVTSPLLPGHDRIQKPKFLLTQALQPPRNSAQGLGNWILDIGIWTVSMAKDLELLKNNVQAFCFSRDPKSQRC